MSGLFRVISESSWLRSAVPRASVVCVVSHVLSCALKSPSMYAFCSWSRYWSCGVYCGGHELAGGMYMLAML